MRFESVCACVFLGTIRGLQQWGTGWKKQSSGEVTTNNAGAPGPCIRGHLALDAPALCNLHLCGVTSKSRCFWERLGQMAIISFLSSASIWCLSIPPRNIHWDGHAPTYRNVKYKRGHTNVNTKTDTDLILAVFWKMVAVKTHKSQRHLLHQGSTARRRLQAQWSMGVQNTPNLLKSWRSWCRVPSGSRPWGWSWSGPCCRQPRGDPCGAVSARGSTKVSGEISRKWMERCGTSRWHGWVVRRREGEPEGNGSLDRGHWRSCACIPNSPLKVQCVRFGRY